MGGIKCLAATLDGRTLASQAHGVICTWDAASGNLLALIQLGDDWDGMSWLAFSPENRYLDGRGRHGRAGVWDARTGKPVASL